MRPEIYRARAVLCFGPVSIDNTSKNSDVGIDRNVEIDKDIHRYR